MSKEKTIKVTHDSVAQKAFAILKKHGLEEGFSVKIVFEKSFDGKESGISVEVRCYFKDSNGQFQSIGSIPRETSAFALAEFESDIIKYVGKNPLIFEGIEEPATEEA